MGATTFLARTSDPSKSGAPVTAGCEEPQIRVFLMLESRLVREAMARIFRKGGDFLVVGSDSNQEGAKQRVFETRSQVLILDFLDPGWLQEFTRCEKGDSAAPKLLLIGMDDDFPRFLSAVQGGAVGYLLKDASVAEIRSAVRAASRGEAVCPPALCGCLFRYLTNKSERANLQAPNGKPQLTLRQQRLTSLVAQGLTNKEIAARLNLSECTVKNHIHRIMKQVDAQSRSEAVAAVQSYGYSLPG